MPNYSFFYPQLAAFPCFSADAHICLIGVSTLNFHVVICRDVHQSLCIDWPSVFMGNDHLLLLFLLSTIRCLVYPIAYALSLVLPYLHGSCWDRCDPVLVDGSLSLGGMYLYPRFAFHPESGGLSVLSWSALVWVFSIAGAEDGGTTWMPSVCVFSFIFVLFGRSFARSKSCDLDG